MHLRGILSLFGLLVVACSNNSTSPTSSRAAVIAHRGSSYVAPEHTIAAYDLALDQDADYIELDVARTSDGILVVIHDATADRTMRGPAADCTGRVIDKTMAQLARCDAGSWFNSNYPSRAKSSYSSLRLPTVADVLDRYSSRARFYIEIKDPDYYPGIETQLASLLTARGISPAPRGGRPRVIIQSFSPASLRRFRSIAPSYPLTQLIGDVATAAIRDSLTSVATYADGIGARSQSIDAGLVTDAHSRCLLVHPYTVDDELEMQSLLAIGVDAIFTNRPDLLRQVVDESNASGDRATSCPS